MTWQGKEGLGLNKQERVARNFVLNSQENSIPSILFQVNDLSKPYLVTFLGLLCFCDFN